MSQINNLPEPLRRRSGGPQPGSGRPKGAVSEKTLAIQRFCRSVLEDPEYRADVLERARTRQLGALEVTLYAYAYGKPRERIEVSVTESLSEMSVEELAAHAAQLSRALDEAKALEEAIDAQVLNDRNVLDASSTEGISPSSPTSSPDGHNAALSAEGPPISSNESSPSSMSDAGKNEAIGRDKPDIEGTSNESGSYVR